MRICWTRQASRDLDSVRAFLAPENPLAAVEQVLRLIQVVEETIAANPAIGKSGRVPRTREFVVPGTPYLLVYRVHRGVLEVLRVLHGARQWPPGKG